MRNRHGFPDYEARRERDATGEQEPPTHGPWCGCEECAVRADRAIDEAKDRRMERDHG